MRLNDYMAELLRTRDTMRTIRDGNVHWIDNPWQDLPWHWAPQGFLVHRILPVVVARKDNIDMLNRMRQALLERAVPELYRGVFHDQARLVFLRKRYVRRSLGRPLTTEEIDNDRHPPA